MHAHTKALIVLGLFAHCWIIYLCGRFAEINALIAYGPMVISTVIYVFVIIAYITDGTQE